MDFVHPAAETYLGLSGYILARFIVVFALSVFLYIMYRRYLLLRCGQSDPRFSSLGKRFLGLFIYGILQKKQPRYLWAGVLHIIIFWGFIILGLHSIDLVVQGLWPGFVLPFMKGSFGTFYNRFKDFFELIVLFACIAAILRRALKKPERYKGSHQFEAYLVLCLIGFIMITDMLFEGSGLLLLHSEGSWQPAAQSAMLILPSTNPQCLTFIYRLSYWLHILCFFCFLNFLPLSKHFHIITALPNVFFRKLLKGTGKPPQWDAADIDTLNTVGIAKFSDFTWKHILDFFSCTECGRCTDNCPANIIGRPLSPKMISMKLRDHGYQNISIFKSKADGSSKSDALSIVGGIISDDEIWSCTTCGRCEEECPVFIEYIDKIMDMRRHLVLMESKIPTEIEQAFRNMETYADPWGKGLALRNDWARELAVNTITDEDADMDILYWVGCAGAYDERYKEVAVSFIKILQASEVNFKILGKQERCCGDFARRTGNEYLFQKLAKKNIEILKKYKVKKIVATCPHCYNTLKNEYPQLGGNFEVFHASEFLMELIKEGRLKFSKKFDKTVSYHDPCYLGRHNGIYDIPREILRHIPKIQIKEMEQSRDKSFCCGAGGGHFWMEEQGTRMNEKRMEHIIEVKPDIISTACPYCLIMLEDGIEVKEIGEWIKAKDLIEIVAEAI
ncbi:MAG: (Fe-S)-binding protein [Dissulfuribacterales bacterium]